MLVWLEPNAYYICFLSRIVFDVAINVSFEMLDLVSGERTFDIAFALLDKTVER